MLMVLVLGVFVGCGMFGKDTAKYRKVTAMTVGNQTITVGKMIDTLNTYARYSSSLSDTVISSVLSSLYERYIKIDAYLDGKSMDNYVDALSEAQQEYVYKYIKYLVFSNFDSSVEEEIKKDVDLNDAETEDTSRDFATYDDWNGAATYTDYLVAQLFVNDDMNEYYDKYYGGSVKADIDVSLAAYATADATAAKLAEYNERIDKDSDNNGEITADKFAKIQEKVVKRYTESIENAYEITMDKFLADQVSDAAANLIVNLYEAEQGRAIDGTDEAYKTICDKLEAAYTKAADAKKANYNFNDTFVSDIEGLSDTSDIYTVPAEYEYIFVKNVLVPFTDQQKAVLSNLETKLGTTDHDYYRQVRMELAAEIVGDDFLSDKNEDGEYAKVSDLFQLNAAKDAVELNPNGEIAKAIAGAEATEEEIVNLMKRFNTDTGSHSKRYDYVVRINAPEDYTSKFVTEFVDAAQAAYDASNNGEKYGTYSLCVSTYGVHIVFFTGKVTAHAFDTALCKDTSSREYQLFKTEYSTQRSDLVSKAYKALRKEYFVVKSDDGKVTSDGKIKFNPVLKSLLKEIGSDFDLEGSIVYAD